jgi:hypothetical protein
VKTPTCADLELALLGDDPELANAFSRHAEGCAACRAEVDLANAITAAAPALRKAWPSPGLDERIRVSLRDEAGYRLRLSSASWVSLAAAASLLVALLARAFLVSPKPPLAEEAEIHMPTIDPATERLLTEKAAAEVAKAEEAYVRSIDALFKLAEPRLQENRSEVLATYREKLLLLDSAIAECRAQVERNRFNAYLRLELLSLYQEKQRTLDSLLKEDLHAL